MTDHRAIISALNESYNNKSYQSRLARWADRLLPFDFEFIHVPRVTLGIVDYLSRYPTFSAPKPFKYDKLFVVKTIEAFNQALTFIKSYNSSKSRNKCCPSSQEGVKLSSHHHNSNSSQHSPEGGDGTFAQNYNQSNYVMQIGSLNSSPTGGVVLCSKPEAVCKLEILEQTTSLKLIISDLNLYETVIYLYQFKNIQSINILNTQKLHIKVLKL